MYVQSLYYYWYIVLPHQLANGRPVLPSCEESVSQSEACFHTRLFELREKLWGAWGRKNHLKLRLVGRSPPPLRRIDVVRQGTTMESVQVWILRARLHQDLFPGGSYSLDKEIWPLSCRDTGRNLQQLENYLIYITIVASW